MKRLPKNPTRAELKEFRKLMTTPGTKFNYGGMMWGKTLAEFEFNSINGEKGWVSKNGSLSSMSVSYVGDTKMDLFTYDMMDNKTTFTIKFKDVTIVTPKVEIEKGVKLTKGGALNFDGDGVVI